MTSRVSPAIKHAAERGNIRALHEAAASIGFNESERVAICAILEGRRYAGCRAADRADLRRKIVLTRDAAV